MVHSKVQLKISILSLSFSANLFSSSVLKLTKPTERKNKKTTTMGVSSHFSLLPVLLHIPIFTIWQPTF